MVADHDTYFFDLNGYIILRGALTNAEVKEINAAVDAIPRLKPGQWFGGIHGHTYGVKDGLNYQQIYEAGEPMEKLIDHPSWFEHVKQFIGGQTSFDSHHGPLFIDENFFNFRGPGEAIGMHSGGDCGTKRTQYHIRDGMWMCGQVNVLMALTDIGPGDGATMVVPCSHKQHLKHPDLAKFAISDQGTAGDNFEGAIEVHLAAGDALLFSDAICHGSARRTNPGERRNIVYRYGPSWGMFRHGYRPTAELLARLTPLRRKIVWPHPAFQRSPNLKPGFNETNPYAGLPTITSEGAGL